MQRIIGPLIINLDGYELTAQDIELINNPLVGGVILFEDNYKDHQQVKDLIESIKKINIDLIVSIDHEGGSCQHRGSERSLVGCAKGRAVCASRSQRCW